ECIRHGRAPLTGGTQGLELVRILEASSRSLRHGGSTVALTGHESVRTNFAAGANGHERDGREKSKGTAANELDGKGRGQRNRAPLRASRGKARTHGTSSSAKNGYCSRLVRHVLTA